MAKTAPRGPKTTPKGSQDGPKTAPQGPQDGPKRPPKNGVPAPWSGIGRREPPRAPRDPSKTNFWSILDPPGPLQDQFLVDFGSIFWPPGASLSLSLSLFIFLSFFSSIIIASNVVIVNQTRGGSVQCRGRGRGKPLPRGSGKGVESTKPL